MAVYEIELPDGSAYEVETPEQPSGRDFSLARGLRQFGVGLAGGATGGLTDVLANRANVPQSALRNIGGIAGLLTPAGIPGRAVKLGATLTRAVPRAGVLGRSIVRATEGALGAGATQLGEAIEQESLAPIFKTAALGGGIGAIVPPAGAIPSATSRLLERFGLKSPRTFPVNPTVDDLAKMTATDRQLYTQIQRQGIQTRSAQKLTDEQNRLRQVGEQLSSQVQSASREAVLKARPQLAKVMSEASPKWRQLVQQSIDDAGDVQVMPQEIIDELTAKFGGNRELVNRALAEIDVNILKQLETPPGGALGQFIRPFNAREVFTRLNQERLSIPIAKRSGESLYGQSEFFKDNVIEALTNVLNRKGVDFSAANQFWAPYAQLRNSLFRSIGPFKGQFGTESGERMFQAVAKGKGKTAEIAELERRTGVDLTGELKDITERSEVAREALRQLPKKVQQQKQFELGELTRKGLLAKGKAEQASARKKLALGAGGVGLSLLGIKFIPSFVRRELER